MAYESDKAEWCKTSSIMATIINVNRGQNQQPIDASELSPYTASKTGKPGQHSIPLNRENIRRFMGLGPG